MPRSVSLMRFSMLRKFPTDKITPQLSSRYQELYFGSLYFGQSTLPFQQDAVFSSKFKIEMGQTAAFPALLGRRHQRDNAITSEY